MTRDERTKRANEIRQGIEEGADDLAAHFEGGIYGEFVLYSSEMGVS